MTAIQNCARCGNWTMECLRTHSHCWECGFFPEDNDGLREWYRLEFRQPRASGRGFKNDRAREQCLGNGSIR